VVSLLCKRLGELGTGKLKKCDCQWAAEARRSLIEYCEAVEHQHFTASRRILCSSPRIQKPEIPAPTNTSYVGPYRDRTDDIHGVNVLRVMTKAR
jgi:hypothetical protein